MPSHSFDRIIVPVTEVGPLKSMLLPINRATPYRIVREMK